MRGDVGNPASQGRPPRRHGVSPHKPITMRTLGDFQRSKGYMMWASCERCGRYKTLDLNALAQRFGRNAPVEWPRGRPRHHLRLAAVDGHLIASPGE